MTDRSDRIWLPLTTPRCSPKACVVRMRCATGMASIPPGAPLQDYSLEPAGGTALCPGFLTMEKAGRSASDDEREYAQYLVETYRALRDGGAFTEEGMQLPDGHVVHANPNMLLFALERLARTGYLRNVGGAKAAATLKVHAAYRAASGNPGRLQDIAETLNTTVSTVERILCHKR